MHRIAPILTALLGFVAHPSAAQEIVYESVTEVVLPSELGPGGARFVVAAPARVPDGIGAYGPFRVLDGTHAALVDVTDTDAPAAFAAMLRDYPDIATLEMIECPGTEDDHANLRLGRMIRARGVATHVPTGGFAGSGAVELFLAGVQRSADAGAQFAVHSWSDDAGREAQDYAADAPENRVYLDYYRAMGLGDGEARAFYAMTNSVPFAQARWLSREDMAQWLPLAAADPATRPELELEAEPIEAVMAGGQLALVAGSPAEPMLDSGLALE